MILSNAQQVRRVCPYYFDLESVFCSRAGMVPACRTDELFGPNAGSITSIARDMDKEGESVDEDDDAVLDEDAVGESESLTTGTARTPVSRSSAGRQQSTKKSSSNVKPASKKRSARRGRILYPEDDKFNHFLSLAIKRSEQSEPKVDNELSSATRMVEMMNAFNNAKTAMQCPIKAAYHCPIFEQFLDKKERKLLKKYKQEQEEDSSDSESGFT